MKNLDTNLLRNAIEIFQEVDPFVPLNMVSTFIWVAQNDGLHQYDLEEYLGASNATASRAIKWWGEWRSYKDNKPGPGFIESYPDPADRRYRVVKLTDSGKKFWKKVQEAKVNGS